MRTYLERVRSRNGRSAGGGSRFVQKKTWRRTEKSSNYMDQLLLRESDCKHHSIVLNRKHTFTGFHPTKLYELPGIEAVHMVTVSDRLVFVLGRHGSIVAINRENPENVYKVGQQYSSHIKGKIYYDEKTDSLLSYREWWCEPYEEEEDDEENHVPIVGVGYYRITQTSIRAGNPSRGTLVLYEEENDSRNWEFDLSNRLIVAEWNNPEFHDGFAAVDMDTIQNVSEAPISNLPTSSNFKIGRSGNSTLIQCSSDIFLNKEEGNVLRVYRKKPFRPIVDLVITPKAGKGLEIVINCEMYIIVKREGRPLKIIDLRVEHSGKHFRKFKTRIFNIEKRYEHIDLCRTQRLLMYLKDGEMGLCDLDNGILQIKLHDISRNPPPNPITKCSTYITDDEDVMIMTDILHPIPHHNQGNMCITISDLDTGECLGKISPVDDFSSSGIPQTTIRESLSQIVALTYDIKKHEIFTCNDSGGIFKWSNN